MSFTSITVPLPDSMIFFPVCPPGTFLNHGGSCEECPIGQWNDQYNQTSCNICDGGKTTQNNGTKYETDCGDCLNRVISCIILIEFD